MTRNEILSIQPGDSIVGAFGAEDEFPVAEVGADVILLRVAGCLCVPYVPIVGGPELLGRRAA